MDGLSLDDILSGDEAAALFSDEESTQEETDNIETPENKEKEDTDDTAEVDVDTLFTEPESVGSEEENNQGKEDTSSKEESSPNFYSSIAKAFVEDGVFQDLDDDSISKVNDAETFKDLVEQTIQAKFDERQKRIDEALNVGIEPTEIQRYENTLNALNGVSDESLEDESEKGENLRKSLIYNDYKQKGFSEERAKKAVERSLANGTDIEDAKEALISCKEYVNKAYKDAIENAKAVQKEAEENIKKEAEALKSNILSDKKAFGEIDLDKATRQKVFDAIAKPVYTDPKTGEKISAIQKFSNENYNDFMKYVGITYVLTDGFKSLDGLIKGKVKKEVSKGLKDLEHTLNNTSRNSNGTLKFTSGVSSDPNSSFSKFSLDI